MLPDGRLRGHQPGLESAQPAVAPFLFPIVPRRQTKRAPAWGALWINWQSALLLAHLGEALAAIDGTVGLGLERHPSLAAAGSAHSGEILTGAAGGILAGVTAGLAALGLVLEAALGVELLLTGGKGELVTALFAYQDLVFVHLVSLSLTRYPEALCMGGVILRSALAGSAGRKVPGHLPADSLDRVVHRLGGPAHPPGDLSAGEAA